MDELRAAIYEETMRECTFKPTITRNAERHGGVSFAAESLQKNRSAAKEDGLRRSDSDPLSGSDEQHSVAVCPETVTVFDRLYSQKDKVPKSIAADKHRTIEEREMDGCTFAPQLYKPFHQTTGVRRTRSLSPPVRRSSSPRTYRVATAAGPRRVSVARMINSVYASGDENSLSSPPGGVRRSKVTRRADSLSDMIFGNATEIPFANSGDADENDEGEMTNIEPPPPPPMEPKGYSTSIQR